MLRDSQIKFFVRAFVCALTCLFVATSASAQVVADAGDDLLLECAADGTEATLDGTGSMVKGAPAVEDIDTEFLWMAAGIDFDDDTSATPTASFPLGVTAVMLTVTHTDPETLDQTSDTDTVEVAVEDTTPPTLSVLAAPMLLWPPSHELHEIDVTLVVEDACDPNPVVELASLVSNEPDNSTGDGNTVDDIQEANLGADDRSFLVRSERKGNGSGRSYTATYTATDESGNLTDAVAHILVPHDQRLKNAANKAAKAAQKAYRMAAKAAAAAKADKNAAKAVRKAARKAASEAKRAARKAAREAKNAAKAAEKAGQS